MFLSRLIMLLEWKKVVAWVIQILCKAPFCALIIVDYINLEIRFYVPIALLEVFFSAIESFLVLIFSNKNTILVFSVIVILFTFVGAFGNILELQFIVENGITFGILFLFIVFNLLFEIVCIFVIITQSSSSFQFSFFVRKLFLSVAKLILVGIVLSFVQFIHNEQILQSRSDRMVLWIIMNTIAISLYMYNISYQLNNEVSWIFLLSIFLICILWIIVMTDCKSAYAATALIVVFIIHCFFWYKLYAVKLISLTVAEFFSQFTLVGALLFAVGHA